METKTNVTIIFLSDKDKINQKETFFQKFKFFYTPKLIDFNISAFSSQVADVIIYKSEFGRKYYLKNRFGKNF